MGERENGALKLKFDRHLRLEFRGAKVTTDAGLLAVRELDSALVLTEMAGEMIRDNRTGRNVQHELTCLLRQSFYARLAGYEDVNDQELLLRDPVMRAVIGKRALDRTAASSGTVTRFETEILAQDENIGALSSLNSEWVTKAVSFSKAKKITLDFVVGCWRWRRQMMDFGSGIMCKEESLGLDVLNHVRDSNSDRKEVFP